MPVRRFVAAAAAMALVCGMLIVPATTAAAPLLTLPFSTGETWKIIQGYNCGSHRDNEDALDMVRTDGPTRGTPVAAAAPGRVTYTGGSTNVVVIDHGGYATMYVHLDSRAVGRGQVVERGQVIGTAGSAGIARSNAHLHFETFIGRYGADRARNTVPSSFVEGYDLPNTGRCNQYGGMLMTKSGAHSTAPADVPDHNAIDASPADVTPPSLPTLLDGGQGQFQVVKWNPSVDEQSGVKGYQLYVGTDPSGTGEWFVPETQAALPALEPGRNYVRIRAIDNAGNASEWTTLLEVNG